MECTSSTIHRRHFAERCIYYLLTTNYVVKKASSTSANELSQQWAVRHSTAHRLEIRRALYLMPSRNKLLALKILTHFSLYIYF